MTTKENKVAEFNKALQKSSLAKRKKAGVELVNGKIFYYTIKTTSSGREYKSRETYRNVLCMLDMKDIKHIMSL